MSRLPLENTPSQRLLLRLGGSPCAVRVDWHPSSSSWMCGFESPPGVLVSYRRIALGEAAVVGRRAGLPADIVCWSDGDREPGENAWSGGHWLAFEPD